MKNNNNRVVFSAQELEFIPSSKTKCPESVFILIIWWGESDKTILNETPLSEILLIDRHCACCTNCCIVLFSVKVSVC